MIELIELKKDVETESASRNFSFEILSQKKIRSALPFLSPFIRRIAGL
jgi:hypothetical protein